MSEMLTVEQLKYVFGTAGGGGASGTGTDSTLYMLQPHSYGEWSRPALGWDFIATYYGRPVQDPCVKCLSRRNQMFVRQGRQTNGDPYYVYHCGLCATEYYSKYSASVAPMDDLCEGDLIIFELSYKVKNFSLYKEEK